MTANILDIYPEEPASQVPTGPSLQQCEQAVADLNGTYELLRQGSFPGYMSGQVVRSMTQIGDMLRQAKLALVKHPEYGKQ